MVSSTYFLLSSAQIRFWARHPFSVSSRTCKNLSWLHRALNHALIASPPRHNEFFGRDTSKHSQLASRSPFSTSAYERFGGKRGSWWIQQRGALRRGPVVPVGRPATPPAVHSRPATGATSVPLSPLPAMAWHAMPASTDQAALRRPRWQWAQQHFRVSPSPASWFEKHTRSMSLSYPPLVFLAHPRHTSPMSWLGDRAAVFLSTSLAWNRRPRRPPQAARPVAA